MQPAQEKLDAIPSVEPRPHSVAGAAPQPVGEINTLRHPRMRVWLIWVALFDGAWCLLNFHLGLWSQAEAHWPMALAMAVGSYVAGSTPMGGGTVGFPVLVLLFHTPASIGRNFGLTIQAVGMTSAAIFIMCRRTPIERRTLFYGALGTILGLFVGGLWVVPAVSDVLQKLIFACLWLSFGVLTLVKNRELCASKHLPAIDVGEAAIVGLLVGIAGGITTALTGVGVNMLLYTVLVLLYRMDLKIAVPTSVVLMAFGSVVGTGMHLVMGDIGRECFYDWLAAAPVVIIGAPVGAFLVSIISREKTLYFVALLCVVQFIWTLGVVRLTVYRWGFVALNLVVATAGLVFLYRIGHLRYQNENDVSPSPDPETK